MSSEGNSYNKFGTVKYFPSGIYIGITIRKNQNKKDSLRKKYKSFVIVLPKDPQHNNPFF